MVRSLGKVLVPCLLACTSCWTPDQGGFESELDEPSWSRVGAAWIPRFTIDPDIDEDELGGGVELTADLEDGEGAALTYGWEFPKDDREEVFNLGIDGIVSHTEHRERRFGGEAEHLLMTAGPTVIARFGRRDLAVRLSVGAGMGYARLDFSPGTGGLSFGDRDGFALSGRGGVALEVLQHAVVEVAVHTYGWGPLGETVATGGFLTLGGQLRF